MHKRRDGKNVVFAKNNEEMNVMYSVERKKNQLDRDEFLKIFRRRDRILVRLLLPAHPLPLLCCVLVDRMDSSDMKVLPLDGLMISSSSSS
jgi:hypothetical protein